MSHCIKWARIRSLAIEEAALPDLRIPLAGTSCSSSEIVALAWLLDSRPEFFSRWSVITSVLPSIGLLALNCSSGWDSLTSSGYNRYTGLLNNLDLFPEKTLMTAPRFWPSCPVMISFTRPSFQKPLLLSSLWIMTMSPTAIDFPVTTAIDFPVNFKAWLLEVGHHLFN